MIDLINIQNTKLPFVIAAAKEDLADYMRRVREQELGISLEEVVRRAKAKGFSISRGYISQIENRYIVSPTALKLQAIAAGLGKSPDELFAIARGKSLEPMMPQDFHSALEAMGVEQFQAYGGVQNLSAEDQQEIIAMVSTLVEQKLKRKQAAKGNATRARKG